jgi:hypothetical protein
MWQVLTKVIRGARRVLGGSKMRRKGSTTSARGGSVRMKVNLRVLVTHVVGGGVSTAVKNSPHLAHDERE